MNGPHQQMTKPKFLIQKSRLETYLLRIFDQNHGLTLLEIFQFFQLYKNDIFIVYIKPPFEKTTSSKVKAKVSFTEK